MFSKSDFDKVVRAVNCDMWDVPWGQPVDFAGRPLLGAMMTFLVF